MSKAITATAFYKLVTKGDIYRAYRYIISNNIELKASTKYNIKLYDKLFPPKDFLRIVAEQKGYKIEETGFNGGQANKPFEDLGYEIMGKETKYWLYAPGTNADHWDEFYEANIMAIGWDALGNLTQYNSKGEVKERLVNAYGGEGSKKNDVTANFDFYHHINVGDVIIAKTGRSTLLGYGIVTSGYFFDGKRANFKSCRSIEWKVKGTWNVDHKLVLKTLTDITRYPSDKTNHKYYYEEIMNFMTNVKQEFSRWLLKNGPKTYKDYYGEELDGIVEKLNEINSYFSGIDLFEVSNENLTKKIDFLKALLYGDLEAENKAFYDYNNKKGNGRPKAIMGKNNYFIFLKEKFDKGMVKNKIEQIESLYQEYLTYLELNDLSKNTINIYANNLKLILTKYDVNDSFEIKDFEYFSNLKFKEYEKLSSSSFEHKGKGLKYFVAFFSDKLPVDYGHPLNQIFYGPPGTGKTYNTINKAVSIADPLFVIDDTTIEGRKALKERYDELVKKGQIVFTTFHQSMAYEDFVEGIKPETTDENQVVYKIEDGFFKKLSLKTANNTSTNFEDAYQQLINDFSNNENEYLVLTTPKGKSFRVNLNSNQNLNLYTSEQINKQGVFTKEKLEKHYLEGNSFDGWEGYVNSVLKYLETKFSLSKEKKRDVNNHVLIIDEINRGNVSAIFGELITLLEPSKRLGNKEALTVTLPYSKETFGVPNNLHIIGTMNTADRSVEALDTALRRRFVFEEMMPKPALLENTNLTDTDIEVKKVLETINKRIEVLIDRDHTIGHSYFINVTSIEELKTTFKDCIIPLLQEYFYGDDGKIGLVLGDGFVRIVDNDDSIFSSFEYQGRESLVSQSYEIIPFDEIDFNEAIAKLLA